MQVLIVEDDQINLFFIQQLLEEQEYQTLGAANGLQGLEMARRHLPDLILLDIRLPDIDGIEVLAQLKSSTLTDKIPVIFLTALGQSADIVKGLRIGADEYITKPLGDGQELVARIATVMRIRNSENRATRLAGLLQALQGVAVAINQGLDLVAAIETVNKLTVSLGEFDWAGVVLEGRFHKRCFSEHVPSEVQMCLQGEPLRDVIHQGRTLIVRDITNVSGETHGTLHEYGIGAYIAAPIIHNQTMIGALYALCGSPSHFSDEQVRAVEGIAMHAAIAINNAQLYTRIKTLEATKSQMLIMAAHDLRNPLTITMNSLSMLDEDLQAAGNLSSMDQQLMELAQRSLAQMQRLIEDILGEGRIEAMLEKGPEELDVGALIREVYEAAQVQAAANNQVLSLSMTQPLPSVRGFRQPLHEAIANLISNALKYTPKGGQIGVIARQEGDEVQIEVQDNGIGIPLDRQGRLFEPFYRARQPGTETIIGSGLGLSMVKQVAERHGGRVWFRSEPGTGSRFTLALPSAVSKTAGPPMLPQGMIHSEV